MSTDKRTLQAVQSVILDFDSCLCGVESLDTLFAQAISKEHDREERIRAFAEITNLGMDGQLSFSESLTQRLALLPDRPLPLAETIEIMRDALSPSGMNFLRRIRPDCVHIVSSGFRELIAPALANNPRSRLHQDMPEIPIHANSLRLAANGRMLGVAPDNPLLEVGGKATLAARLKLPRPTLVIGDGRTDYEIVARGAADYFCAYTEFVRRERVIPHATFVADNFDDIARRIPQLF